ncbi:flavin reductase family protein [Kitasatospora mediocidica]|uniref:flavin reductase family protein n=1 Tax=Kitasatospora mediocidica TaxID=58352 RepID=UPI00055E9BE5|nr:flavin reductase family protein [Kitasatospora mediocidica]
MSTQLASFTEDFRRAMGLFPTGVAVVSAGSGERTEAVTASSLTSVSLDPLLVLVSIKATGRLCEAIDSAAGFAVNVLSAEQRALSDLFAAHERPRGLLAQQQLGGVVAPSGHLLVPGAVFSLECRTEHRYPGGDHVLFLGRVGALHTAEPARSPLVHHRGAYTALPH